MMQAMNQRLRNPMSRSNLPVGQPLNHDSFDEDFGFAHPLTVAELRSQCRETSRTDHTNRSPCRETPVHTVLNPDTVIPSDVMSQDVVNG
jgi:hypothetical protein